MTNKIKRGRIAFLCALILLISAACTPYQVGRTPVSSASLTLNGSLLQIDVIDVGNADAILICQGGESLLIDAGENGDGDNVVNFLRSRRVDSLDYVIATHPDADHIGGMDIVINEIPVGKFIMSVMPDSITPTTKTYLDLLEELDSKNVDVTEAGPGSRYSLGKAAINLLGPAGEFNSTNSMSVVCRVDFGKRRFLFMGDAGIDAEDALLSANADLKADFIKIAHHGSHSSSQEIFLTAVDPEYAAISCGVNNRYKHPHPKTLALLKNLGIFCYRTDLSGTVSFTSDGDTIAVKTEK